MNRLPQWIVATVLALVLFILGSSRAVAQCQNGWLDAPDIPAANYGTNGLVRAVVSWTPSGATQPILVAGGVFTTAGGVSANNIATWDGASWQPMSTGLTGSGAGVWALTVFNNQLIAAGAFTVAGSTSANNIASWNGSTWSPLGGGLTAAGTVNVRALTVFNGQLYASGEFSSAGGGAITGMARWNGSLWSSAPAGPGGETGAWALTVYNSQLYAGGVGSLNGSVLLYRFDGSTWFTTPGALNGTIDVNDSFPTIRALTVYNNQLVVGGNFVNAGGLNNVGGIASWNGSTWGAFSTGMNQQVYALTTVGGTLYAGGAFTTAGSVLSFRTARWTGSNWTGPATSMTGSGTLSVLAVCSHNGEFIAGGNFATVTGPNTVTANNLGRYNPTSIQWLPAHTATPIRVMTGGVTAGGDFTVSTSTGTAQHVVGWDGTELGTLSTLTGFTGPNGPVYCIGSYNPSPLMVGYTVLGGSFSGAGGNPANNICTYRLSTYGTLGSGFNGSVRALATFNNTLYAAGDFTLSGSVSCSHVAKYVGGVWQDVAGGTNGSVYALYVFNGTLFAGGTFTAAGGTSGINYLAAYNGTSWSATGDGLLSNGTGSGVYCMTSYGLAGNINSPFLAIGGKFITTTNSVQNLASRGSLTFALGGFGSTVNDTVRALAIYQGALVAGGDFTATPGGPMSHIARFIFGTGGGWQAMGSGVDATVYALLPAFETELHVGGSFTEAGGVFSEHWARWNTTGDPAIAQQPFNQFTDGNCSATFTIIPIGSYTGLTFQWRKNGVPISNGVTATGSIISGATTTSLSISNADQPDVAAYSCAVTNSCGTTVTNSATLTVQCCGHADFNHDGDVGTDADIEAFFACLGGSCCATCGSADFNGDGDVGTDADIEAFFRVLGGGAC